MDNEGQQKAEILNGMLDVHAETLHMLFDAGVLSRDAAIDKFEKARKLLEQHGLPAGRTLALREIVTRLRGWR